MGRRATAHRALALLAWLGLVTASSDALPRAEEPWIRADTRNFTIFSNADVEVVSALSSDLELLHSVLESLNRGRTLVSPIPTYVFIFRDEESFRPYKLRVGGQPAPISGYFLSHQHANFVRAKKGALLGARRVWCSPPRSSRPYEIASVGMSRPSCC